MRNAWIVAALALMPMQVEALTVTCNSYVARRYPQIRLEERTGTFTISWEKWTTTLTKTVSKRFGALVEGGVDMGDQEAGEHTVVRDTLAGEPAIIVDSIIFVPACGK